MRIHELFRTLLPSILLISWIGHAEAQVARLTFQSQPGDYIGEGLTRDIIYTPDNGAYFSADVRRTLPSGAPAEIIFTLGFGETPFALLFFGTDQLGIPMQPGFYPNAQRADLRVRGIPAWMSALITGDATQ
jgi:hypothetical protein